MPELYSPDFDHVFRVNEDGTVSDVEDVWAPSVFHDDENDVEIDSEDWEPLTGYTGQYSYHGAVMHASERFAGRIYRDVMAEPGVYVLVVVECYPDLICPSCGEREEWCQGHGQIGDPVGYRIALAHDRGWHGRCAGKCEDGWCYEIDPEPAGWAVLRHKEA